MILLAALFLAVLAGFAFGLFVGRRTVTPAATRGSVVDRVQAWTGPRLEADGIEGPAAAVSRRGGLPVVASGPGRQRGSRAPDYSGLRVRDASG